MSKKYFNYINECHNPYDKENCIALHIKYMLLRTRRMFKWNNLPDTIPEKFMELFLQTSGDVAFTKVNDDYYVLQGGFGGEPDPYYIPTNYVVSNPALAFSKELKIDKDCIVIQNDSICAGLLPLFRRYASALVENEISMRLVTINTRVTSLLSAEDDRTLASARQFIDDMEKGKISIVAENAFLDGIKAQPYGSVGSVNAIKDLIEQEQYLTARWYNEIGLQSNFNMKRESINSAESSLNDDILFPLVDDMLGCRQEACEKINELYGLNISVELASSWDDNQIELDAELDAVEELTKDVDEGEVNVDANEDIE